MHLGSLPNSIESEVGEMPSLHRFPPVHAANQTPWAMTTLQIILGDEASAARGEELR